MNSVREKNERASKYFDGRHVPDTAAATAALGIQYMD